MVAQANELVKAAARLRAMGMVILAVRSRNRRPLGSWLSLQHGPQSETSYRAMLDALRRGQADRIALVCGHGGLVCLDVDADGDAPVADGVIAALLSALGLPADYGWAGPSSSGRGWHIWLMIHDLPEDLTKIMRLPRKAGTFRALEVRAWKHSSTIPIRDGVIGYRGPIPDTPPVARSWADVQAAIETVCAPPAPGDPAQAWAQAALDRETEAVRRAPVGTRNETLNRAAFALGQIVAAGYLHEDTVVDHLIDAALEAGLAPPEVGPTIRSGLRAGAAHPRHPPERQSRHNGWHPDAPLPPASPAEAFERTTDLGNARRLVRQHGRDLRYVHTWGQWLVWDGRRWVKDETGAVQRRARETVRAIYEEASRASDHETAKRLARWAIQSESAGRLSAMVEVARSEEEVAITHRSLDANSWLVAARNGTIDLRTGALLPHRREDLITRMVEADYDPEATCPTWLTFLDRVTGGDAELQTYLQRAVGYTLSGDTSEQCLFFAHGGGSNGKSTFFNVLSALFGDYGLKIEAESLMTKNHSSIPNDLARLPGARLVVSSELSGGRLNEARIKDLTGGDVMVARFLRAEFFEFTPILKLWMYGNHKPIIHGADHGIWRRIRLVPFTVTIPDEEKDPHLLKKLMAELPGILAWAVRGCLDWQREGLPVPAVVREATEEYRSDMDVIGRCLDEICIAHPKAQVAASALYQAYEAWCEANGEHALSQTAFGERLNQRGIGKVRTGRGIVRIGIGLRADREGSEPGPTPEPAPALEPGPTPEPVVVVAPEPGPTPEPAPALAAEPAPEPPVMARHVASLGHGIVAKLAVELIRPRLAPPWRVERCTENGTPEVMGDYVRLVRSPTATRPLTTTLPRSAETVEDLVAQVMSDWEEANDGAP